MILKKYQSLITLIFLIIFLQCSTKTKDNKQSPNLTVNQSIITDKVINKSKNTQKKDTLSEIEKHLYSVGMVNIRDSLPQIIVEIKYATKDNFLKFAFYRSLNAAFVQPECFQKLKLAYNILQDTLPGYTFIIYDATRSIEAQQIMWDSIKAPQNQKQWYVANPEKGSIHNYGMALDLTIANNKGEALDMGTEFDFFGKLAYPDNTDYFYNIGKLSQIQYSNRKLLLDIMKKAGFTVSKTEWWHYNASSLKYAKSKYQIFSEKI